MACPIGLPWQQIRSLQDYDRIMFIGMNPDEVNDVVGNKKRFRG
jgi:light-regulated signal transduction histidine kinase (bacteriophytochrome)